MYKKSTPKANYITFVAFSEDHKTGIHAQFLIDTGASVSIINYDTYEAISKLQKLKIRKAPTTVRAANNNLIPFYGLTTVSFHLENNEKNSFEHEFWIAEKKNSCKANLIGMDWIQNHCSTMNFISNTIKVKTIKDGIIQIATKKTKPFPYFTKMFAIFVGKKVQINPRYGRLFKCKPEGLKFIPKHTMFLPSDEFEKCNLIIYDTAINSKEEVYPIAI